MGDTVFSAKIDETIKAKFEEMAQAAGTTQKEFFGRLVAAFEAAQARESVAEVKEIEQLRHHLARIEEIYIAITKASKDREDAQVGKIAGLEQEVLQAKATAQDAIEQLNKLTEQHKEQLDSARSEAALAREEAAKEVEKYKDDLARARESQEQSSRLATLAEEAASASKAKAEELQESANMAQQHLKDLKDMKWERDQLALQLEDAEKRLTRQAEKAEVEKERAVLAAQRDSMKEVAKLREDLSQVRDALAKAREEKAELEVKIARAGQKPGTEQPE